MGATDSKQKLGERVMAARKKLDEDRKFQSDRANMLRLKSPETMKNIIDSIEESFTSCSPFLEPSLLIAWQYNPQRCQDIILKSCRKVLSTPIIKSEYTWFQQYVFPSSIWMFKTKQNSFMYEELMYIANDHSTDIINSMNSIYNHLQYHPQWKQLLDIKNETLISRQDHKKVGLLQEKGIRDILISSDVKESDFDDSLEVVKSFIDSNLAINILSTTAKSINDEFQNHIQTVMSHFGDFAAGPMKKVERCLSKLENDYQTAQYPKASKLLDLVRCSVTFNTINQLITGYQGMMRHIAKHPSMLELARIKNGFLDTAAVHSGYRDIKINVLYHSPINIGVSMICEIQLLLGQYLHEKKRIHKLYNIIRQEVYFKMTVSVEKKNESVLDLFNSKDGTGLTFEPVLTLANVDGADGLRQSVHQGLDTIIKTTVELGKCSVDEQLDLLAVESKEHICCVDINEKKIIFQEKRRYNCMMFSHNWISMHGRKYLSAQTSAHIIKFFEIKQDDSYSFEESKKYELCLTENDTINCCEFDRKFENIIVVRNSKILEKRALVNINEVVICIKLKEKIKGKRLSLSSDGELCIVVGGRNTHYFYLIDIKKQKQYKLIARNLKHTWAACFINGEREYFVVGGDTGKIQLWNVENRKLVKVIDINTTQNVKCVNSTNNVLAIGSNDKQLRLLDTESWKIFYSQQYEMFPRSVHLTSGSKYLTIGGGGGEYCVVSSLK